MKTPKRETASEVFALLNKNYPRAKIVLKYNNNWQLLVAVILSAQCTDERVNKVTSTLFEKYKEVKDYARADISEFEKMTKPTGFYRQKTKNILTSAKIIEKKYHGQLPRTMNELTKLPGVARKTANVVLGNAFGKSPGIAVDTHVRRLSQRLGLTKNSDPVKIEKDLMDIFDKKYWFKLTYLLIEHGRKICQAKKPACNRCFLNKICPSAYEFPQFKS